MSNGLKTGVVIGAGEVGKSLHRILAKEYEIHIVDRGGKSELKPDVLHICIPYTTKFRTTVRDYIKYYKPKTTVIHSTVPVGTTEKLGKNVFHSPIRGKHPHLDKGITTFVKDIGGDDQKMGKELEEYFKNAGINARYGSLSSRDTEFAKIMCTTYYGWVIVFCKEMEKLCKKKGLNFGFCYKKFNEDYNEGYTNLGNKEFVRPILKSMPGKIGGHCVINNCRLDKNEITKLILKFNSKYGENN